LVKKVVHDYASWNEVIGSNPAPANWRELMVPCSKKPCVTTLPRTSIMVHNFGATCRLWQVPIQRISKDGIELGVEISVDWCRISEGEWDSLVGAKFDLIDSRALLR
jgi:hypothetical protein